MRCAFGCEDATARTSIDQKVYCTHSQWLTATGEPHAIVKFQHGNPDMSTCSGAIVSPMHNIVAAGSQTGVAILYKMRLTYNT